MSCYITYKGKNYTQEDFLDYLKSLLPTSSTSNNPAEFTNHSGGAKGGDMKGWDAIGRKFGVTNHNHYTVAYYDKLTEQEKTELDKQYLETVRFLGRGVISKDTYAGKLVRRDMIQANNGESVYGVTELIKPGVKGRKGYNNKMSYSIPEGGTGYATARGILLNKPTYIFNQSDKYGNEIGWYKWDNNVKDFVKTDIPILSKNFTGIGSQEINELGLQAIRDVYEKTFNESLSKPQETTIKPGVEELFESNPELANEVYDVLGFNKESNLSEKNIFTVEPIQSVDKKAKSKAKIATQYIGFAEGIVGSSTALYAKQAGKYANTGNYSPSDVIFVSIGGRRGNEAIRKIQQDRTIKEAIKALEAGATLITDNEAYVESNSYNEGEKRLAANLKAKGYVYSEVIVDGNTLGVWNVNNNSTNIKLPSSYKGIPIIQGPINTFKNIPVAARYRKSEGVIYADPIQLQEKFNNKAWTKPALQKDGSEATALPENQFETVEEFVVFALEHEFAHSHIFKQEGETTGQYEDRINQEALKQIQLLTEENSSNETSTDTYQYYGAKYEIITVGGVGVQVKNYKGSHQNQQKLLQAYNNNKDIDPQNGKKFRNLSPLEELEQKITGGTSDTLSLSKYELFPGVYANEGQAAAIDAIEEFFAGDKDQFLLKGRGGTGKTTIVKKTLEQFDKSRVKILGSTISYEAKNVLQDNMQGYKTATLASVLGLIPDYAKDGSMFFREKTLEERMNNSGLITPLPIETVDILIVDEASMIDEFIYNKLLELKKPRTKILFMGDNVQIPPINSRTDEEGNVIKGENSDSPVWQLIDSGDYVELSERMRQGAESPILPITDLYAKNVEEIQSGETGLKNPLTDRTSNFQNNEGVLFTSDVNEVVNQFVEDIEGSTDIREAVIVGARNAVVDDMNLRVRKKLFETEEPFVIGDSIRINSPHVENNEVIFENGLRAKVKDVYELPEDNLGLKRYELEIEYIETNEKGDKFIRKAFLKTISPQDQKQYKNKLREMAARAKSFVPKTPESKKAWKEFFDIKSSTVDVGYGYAITSHKVQGSTYNSAYVLEGDIMSFPGGIEQTNRMMYTAVSRPRKKLVIFNPSVVESQQVSQPTKVDIRAKVYELFNLQGYMDIKTSHKTDKNLITAISHYVLEDLGYKTDQEKLQAVREGFKLSEYITTEQISDVHTRVRLNMKNIIEDEVDDGPVSLGGIKFTSSGYESDAKNAFTCK